MSEAGALAGIELPVRFRDRLAGYAASAIGTGQSGAEVLRLQAPERPTLYLKRGGPDERDEVEREAHRLRWLRSAGVPCPAVVDTAGAQHDFWLLTTQVAGRSLDAAADLGPARIVSICAEALSRLHGLDVQACPFDARFDLQLSRARERVEAGRVDELDFDDVHAGQSASELLSRLRARRPTAEDLVVTHGDATFENLVEHEGRFSGFVDCGRLGVADRYRDLALASRSIEAAFGPAWVEQFFQRYGQPMDPHRIALYRLMDELF